MRGTSFFRKCVAMAMVLTLLFSGTFTASGDTENGTSFYSEWFSLETWEIMETEDDESELEEVEDQGDETEVADTIVIRNPQIGIEFLSGADIVANGDGTDLVWKADTNRSGHEFAFRVNYSFSVDTEIMQNWQPGQIEIRIPAAILRDREGNLADDIFMTVPHADAEGLTDANLYVYRIEGEEIVIRNRLPVDPTQYGYFELSYATTKSTYDYMDYLSGSDYASDPLSATLIIHGMKTEEDGTKAVDSDSSLYQGKSSELQVCIDTDAKITSTQKSIYGGARDTWDADWGANPDEPEEEGKYKYLMWRVTSVFEASQPFTYMISDYFNPEMGEFVGYLLQGERSVRVEEPISVYIPALNSMRESRTDSVITKIEKAYYDQLLEENGSFEILNQVTAKVTPGDGVDAATERSDSAPYSERKSVYRAPGGVVSAGKSGLSTSYDLTKLRLGAEQSGMDEISGLMYRVSLDGTTYKMTYDGDEDLIEKPEGKDNFGKKLVAFSVNDQRLWLVYEDQGGENRNSGQLTADDYRIDNLNFNCAIRKAEYSETDLSFHSAEMSPEEIAQAAADQKLTDLVFTIYREETALGKVVYHFADGSYQADNELSGIVTSAENGYIRFSPEANVTGYTAEFSNALYSTSLTITPSVTLKRSEKVKEILKEIPEEDFDAELWNRADFSVTSDGNEAYTSSRDGRDYLLGDTRGSRISKSYRSRQNDTVRGRYLIVWETSMEDYYTIRNQTYDVWQKGGTFVDLLPDGFVYVPESLICYADDLMLQEGQYSVEIVSDQEEGEGRARMTVKMGVPAYQYRIVYTTAATWDTIVRLRRAAGTETAVRAHNAAAYITDNESIGPFQADQSGTDSTDTLITKDLYENPDNEARIISTGADAPVGALVSSSSGLDKLVRTTEANSTYRKTASVYADSEYSYRLHFGPAIGSKADELIVYDFLESFPGTTWHGTLSSVDTAEASAYGSNPVVYYCTLDREQISGNETLYTDLEAEYQGRPVWTGTAPENLSDVTGIAVDMSQTKDGGDFILDGGQSISIIIYMHAPDAIVMDGDEAVLNAPAYNEVFLHQRLSYENEDFEGNGSVISQGHTEVYYYISGELALRKTDQAGEPIQDIQFRLQGTSAYGSAVDMTLASRADGMVIFENIEVGTYTLEETGYSPDYLPISEKLTVVVDERGNCAISDDPMPAAVQRPEEGGTAYTVTDLPRVHGALKFTKQGRIDGQADQTYPLKGVTFRLSGVSEYGNLIDLYAESDGMGIVSFPDVEMGTYDLAELSTAEHYVLLESPMTVTCDADGLIIMSGENVTQSIDGAYTVYNEPLHSLALIKVDAVNGQTLSEAVFQLSGMAMDGTLVNQVQTSHVSGALQFDDLKTGVYLLQEIQQPDGYLASDILYTVLVEENGKITISWTDANGAEHQISNAKTTDGAEQIYAPGYGIAGADHPASAETAFDFAYARFQMPNERDKNGVITINKVWLLDNGGQNRDTDNMPVPVVHVDTTVPEAPKKKAMMDRGLWITKVRDVSEFNKATYFGHYPSTYADPTEEELESNKWTLISYDVPGEYDGRIYVKMDGTNLYWWSDSTEVYLPSYMQGYYSTIGGTTYEGTCNRFFAGFNNITEINLTDLKDDFVNNTESMFNGCAKLETVTFPNYFGSHSVTMKEMFNRCYKLENINETALRTSSCTTFEDMFFMCWSLKSLDLSNFNTAKGKIFSGMLNMNDDNKSALTSVNISGWDLTNATTMQNMFNQCDNLTSLNMSNVTGGENLTTLQRAFRRLRKLEGTLDLSWLRGTQVSNMNSIFSNCGKLTKIDISGMDPASLSDVGDAFENCTALKTILVGEAWRNFGANKSNTNMFQGCTSIEVADVNVWAGASISHAIIGTAPNGTVGYFTLKTASADTSTENAGSHVEPQFPNTAYYIASLWPVRKKAGNVPEDTRDSEAGKAAAGKDTTEVKAGEGTGSATSVQIELVTGGSPYKAAAGEDTSQIYDQWIINPDGTWTWHFQTYDDELTYYVYEELISGFTWTDPQHEGYYSTIEHSATETNRNSVTITNKRNAQPTPAPTATPAPSPKPTATPTPVSYGAITITKDIQLAEGVAMGQDAGRQFNFEISLDPKPAGILYAVKKTADNQEVLLPVSFSGGKNPTVSLEDGESITLQRIPMGTAYTVTEETDRRFRTTINNMEGTVGSGTISSTEPISLDYVNTKEKNDLSGGFILEKQLGSTTVCTDSFSFVINLTGLLPGSAYRWNRIDASGEVSPQSFTTDARGGANLMISLGAGEKADFSAGVCMLPVGSGYMITEFASSLVASYTVSRDPSCPAGRIARSADANAANNTALSTARETVDENEQIQVVFTNADPGYTIRFQKYGSREGAVDALRGASLALYRLEGVIETENAETYESEIYLTTFISNISPKELELKPGEYLIREVSAPASYIRADSLRFRIDEYGYAQYWSVKETGNNLIRSDEDSWGGMASNTIMQMIDPYIAPAELRIPVQKTLKGRDMLEEEFEFRMTPISAEGVRDEEKAIRITNPSSLSGETATFYFEKSLTVQDYEEAIYQSAEGGKVLFYVIQEEQGNSSGISYDERQYIVKVLLSLTENELITQTWFYLYGGSGDLPRDAIGELISGKQAK